MGKTFTILIVGGHMHPSISDLLLLKLSSSSLHIVRPQETRVRGLTVRIDEQNLLEEIDRHESEHVRRTHKVLVPALKLASDAFIDTSLTLLDKIERRERRAYDGRSMMTNLVKAIIEDASLLAKQQEEEIIPFLNIPVSAQSGHLPTFYPYQALVCTIAMCTLYTYRTYRIRPPPARGGFLFIKSVEF